MLIHQLSPVVFQRHQPEKKHAGYFVGNLAQDLFFGATKTTPIAVDLENFKDIGEPAWETLTQSVMEKSNQHGLRSDDVKAALVSVLNELLIRNRKATEFIIQSYGLLNGTRAIQGPELIRHFGVDILTKIDRYQDFVFSRLIKALPISTMAGSSAPRTPNSARAVRAGDKPSTPMSKGGKTPESGQTERNVPLPDEIRSYLNAINPYPLLQTKENERKLAQTIEAAKLIGYCIQQGISLNKVFTSPFEFEVLRIIERSAKGVKRSPRLQIIDSQVVANRMGRKLEAADWKTIREKFSLLKISVDGNHISYGDAYQVVTKEVATAIGELLEAGKAAELQFFQSNTRLAFDYAKKRYYVLPPDLQRKITFIDLIQAANAGPTLVDESKSDNLSGLMSAIRMFDWREGYKFSTFATFWLRQAVDREIANTRDTIRTPGYIQDLLLKLVQCTRALTEALKRPPTDEELAKEMNISEEQLATIYKAQASQDSTSLDAPLKPDSDDDTTRHDILPAVQTDMDEIVIRSEVISLLRSKIQELKLAASLMGRDGEMLAAYYYFDNPELWGTANTQQAVGELYGLNRSRAEIALSKLAPLLVDEPDENLITKARIYSILSILSVTGAGNPHNVFVREVVKRMGTLPPIFTQEDIQLINVGILKNAEDKVSESKISTRVKQVKLPILRFKILLAAGEELIIGTAQELQQDPKFKKHADAILERIKEMDQILESEQTASTA